MSTSPAPPPPEVLQRTIDRFWETIPPTWNRIRSRLRAVAAENFDITIEQFHILRHVRKGVNSVSDLATEKHISRPAISQAVELLVHKGLITRRQIADDRRCVRLELTPNGDALLNTIFENNRAWMAEKLAALSEAELSGLIQAMQLLNRAFDDSTIDR